MLSDASGGREKEAASKITRSLPSGEFFEQRIHLTIGRSVLQSESRCREIFCRSADVSLYRKAGIKCYRGCGAPLFLKLKDI